MQRFFKRAAVVLAATGAIAAGGAGVSNAATYAGDLSQFGHLKPYCEKVVYRDVASKWNVSASPMNAFNPYSWACRFAPVFSRPLDMNSACKYYYGSRSYAVVTNKNWAWGSWKCYR